MSMLPVHYISILLSHDECPQCLSIMHAYTASVQYCICSSVWGGMIITVSVPVQGVHGSGFLKLGGSQFFFGINLYLCWILQNPWNSLCRIPGGKSAWNSEKIPELNKNYCNLEKERVLRLPWMRTWKHGEMDHERGHGNIETWRHGDMKTWRHGNMEDMKTWRPVHGHGDMDMVTWTCRRGHAGVDM